MSSTRVLLLSTDLNRGGLPLRLVRLAEQFHSVGVDPIVGCLAPRGPLHEDLDSAGVASFSCDARGRFDASCLARLAASIRYFNPDLVHASLFHANLAARMVGRWDRSRPIVTASVTVEIERRWHRTLEGLTAGLSDLHAANSTAVARHLIDELSFPADRVVTVPNAVNFELLSSTPAILRRQHGLREDMPLVVWAGRMDPVKNLPFWVDVVAEVSREIPVQGVLLGDGADRPRIESRIEQHGLSRWIRLPGWCHDTAAWFHAADLFMFPSMTEGSPNAVLEALCCGCPVLVSDIPACAAVIDEAGTGRACRIGDTSEWARAALSILSERAHTASEAPQRARSTVDRLKRSHSMPAVLSAWRRIYDRLLA
ncbi:MAG: glycosyltransferase [Phycisphaerae bacterium]|nr:glycosyltransferase [Phycisphaerae bacterium]